MSGAVAISCLGVTKRFPLSEGPNGWRLALARGSGLPTFTALEDVTFDVLQGKFVGVMGRNGAGKSTLLRILGGVYNPDQGRVELSGELSGLYELGLVGNPQLTGREYASRLLTIQNFPSGSIPSALADIQEFSELGDRFDDAVQGYSAGMKARLFFATATAGHYDVYLLDEILSVGDQHFQSKCWRRLRDRVSGGASGVLVTHDWASILRMCETAHILERGRVVYSGPAEHAVRRYLYGESSKETFHEGIARLTGDHRRPLMLTSGHELALEVEAEILVDATVGCVVAVERLQAGFGWETCLMSREISQVGTVAGRYSIEVRVPRCPLEPGNYQISVHLVMSAPDRQSARLVLDGWSWLNGNGIELTVVGEPSKGAALPMQWHRRTLASA